jgi:hypothetical protein
MIRHFHRSRTTAGSRRWLVLLSALWLNLAILPCAMALETASEPGHDCCPPVLELAAAADCCELDSVNVENREFEPSKDSVAMCSTMPVSRKAVFTSLQAQPPPPDPDSPAPPLHLLNCVFLK